MDENYHNFVSKAQFELVFPITAGFRKEYHLGCLTLPFDLSVLLLVKEAGKKQLFH
ncbi:MAG: hypothetical protein KUG78_19990 [Kangiellaceae bacterium]|nr:hypothetical protein [Kangiellaceae bacterium]